MKKRGSVIKTWSVIAACLCLFTAVAGADWITLLDHDFSGGSNGAVLRDTAVQNFSIATGGSITGNWFTSSGNDTTTGTPFRQDGTVSSAAYPTTPPYSFAGARSASISLGSFVTDTKGTANGLFRLTVSLTVDDVWIDFGFSSEETPDPGTFSLNVGGFGMLRPDARDDTVRTSVFEGGNSEDFTGHFGAENYTVELDYRDYNVGEENFGTITWFADDTELRSFALTSDLDYDPGAILISRSGISPGGQGTLHNVTLQQIPEPGTMGMLLAGMMGLLALRRRLRS